MSEFKWWVFFDLRKLSCQNTIIKAEKIQKFIRRKAGKLNADVIELEKRLA